MEILDLGSIPYRQAWELQEQIHAQVLERTAEEQLLLLEHPPVITLGRRPGLERNIIAPPEQLANLNVEVVHSDRGGDVTLHAPGQLVAYPIIRLADHELSVGAYVRKLQDIVVAVLTRFSIPAQLDADAIGVWAPSSASDPRLAKICAFGVRIRRGVSLHGLALNVSTNLDYFNLINPCGLSRPVTSMQAILGEQTPAMALIKDALAGEFQRNFAPRGRPKP